jgi:predicted transcriptional regulator
MRTLTLAIPDEVAARLDELAEREFRRSKDQASILLVEAIRRHDRRMRRRVMPEDRRADGAIR